MCVRWKLFAVESWGSREKQKWTNKTIMLPRAFRKHEPVEEIRHEWWGHDGAVVSIVSAHDCWIRLNLVHIIVVHTRMQIISVVWVTLSVQCGTCMKFNNGIPWRDVYWGDLLSRLLRIFTFNRSEGLQPCWRLCKTAYCRHGGALSQMHVVSMLTRLSRPDVSRWKMCHAPTFLESAASWLKQTSQEVQ